MCIATQILSIHFSRMLEATQFWAKVRSVIKENLQGSKLNLILSIHLLKIENFLLLQILKFCGLIIGFWTGLFGVIFSKKL